MQTSAADRAVDLAQLSRQARDAGLEPLDLDELVHELTSRIASQRVNDGADYDDAHDVADAAAAEVNNGGLPAQLGCILDHLGRAGAAAAIAELG